MWFRNQQEIKMKFYYLKIILFLFFINIVHAASDNLTIPNTFSDGEVVSASKFNANFEAVKNKVNKLNLGKSIMFPDGFIGTPIIRNTAYTVPSGSVLYILTFYDRLQIDNIECAKSVSPVLESPIIVPAGKTVVPVDDGSFNGFIIDNASFEGFHTTLAANGTYTVANDKILVVTSWFSQSEMGNSQEKYKIDNITVVSYGRQHSLLMVPSGSTLKNANPNSQSSCITGYLISK